jgi:alpha-mannosidase
MARRLGNLEGAPKASWRKVSDALDTIFGKEKDWPEWRGELYLELHRGTYTTQAKTKRYNRKLEFALRNIEWLYSIASQEGLAQYPKDVLLKNWKVLLTNQFHDIIPGSSIGRVYAEAAMAYKKIEEELASLAVSVRKKILSKLGGGVAVFNDLSWERSDPVTLDVTALGKAAALKASGGVAASPNKRSVVKTSTGIYPLQRYKDIDGKETSVFNPKLPSLGWSHFTALSTKEASGVEGLKLDSPFNYREKTLRTPFYKIKFDKAGRIVSLFDVKAKRELVAQGGNFNGFVSAQDVPILWEAWDIDSDWT